MNIAGIRAEIVAELQPLMPTPAGYAFPVPVCDDEPATINRTAIVVAWASTTPVAAGWDHTYEIRIIPIELEAAPAIAERDQLTGIVVTWAHTTTLSSRRSGASKGTATVGKQQYPAVIVTTNVIEPQA